MTPPSGAYYVCELCPADTFVPAHGDHAVALAELGWELLDGPDGVAVALCPVHADDEGEPVRPVVDVPLPGLGSHGASHCAGLAERAGIPTRRFTP